MFHMAPSIVRSAMLGQKMFLVISVISLFLTAIVVAETDVSD